jgi:DNA-binding CsgD family transcriptional regulator
MGNTQFVRQITSKLDQWTQTNFNQSEDDRVGVLLDNVSLLETHPIYAEIAFSIIRINPLELVYVSNIATKKYFFDAKIKHIHELIAGIDKSHLSFISKAIDMVEYYKKIERSIPTIKMSVCGIKALVEGIEKIIAMHIHYLMFDDENRPTVVMVITDDISALFEAPNYWIRCEMSVQGIVNNKLLYFHSEADKIFDHDIVSDRELSILKLMNDGLDTDTIADELAISANTVNNHKQNMYKRTGARNGTALIELAIMCGFFE